MAKRKKTKKKAKAKPAAKARKVAKAKNSSLRKKLKKPELKELNIAKEVERSFQHRYHFTYYCKEYSRVLYWMSVVVLLLSNFLVAVALVPFLTVITTPFAYLVVCLLGLLFGYLFNLLITDIEHLEKHHHIIGIVFIPLIALLNLMITTNTANTLSVLLRANVLHNPLQVSAVYALSFALPYFFSKAFLIEKI